MSRPVLYCKYSNSFPALHRVFTYVYKVARRVRHKRITVHDPKTGAPMLMCVVKRDHLCDEIRTLQRKGMVASGILLPPIAISPFFDQFGLLTGIRVYGRLKNKELSAKHNN